MTTTSGVSATNNYAYTAPASSAASAASAKTSGTSQTGTNFSAFDSVLASFGNSASSPLTYSASGLLSSTAQGASGTTGTAKMTPQTAKEAVNAAQNVVSDTLNALLSNSSADSANASSSDFFGLYASSGTSNSNDPFSLLQNPLANNSANTATGGATAQTAQDAVFAAQNMVTNTMNSLWSSSNSSGSGK